MDAEELKPEALSLKRSAEDAEDPHARRPRLTDDARDVESAAAQAVVCFHTQGTPLLFHDSAGRAHRLTFHQLFPLTTRSLVAPKSPTLSVQQIQELPRESLLRAADAMESFFTYQHEMGNLHGHNNLRITRILKCLALRGLSREARAFRDFAVGLTGESRISSTYWDPVVDDLGEDSDPESP